VKEALDLLSRERFDLVIVGNDSHNEDEQKKRPERERAIKRQFVRI
jgi:hypothetical protein